MSSNSSCDNPYVRWINARIANIYVFSGGKQSNHLYEHNWCQLSSVSQQPSSLQWIQTYLRLWYIKHQKGSHHCITSQWPKLSSLPFKYKLVDWWSVAKQTTCMSRSYFEENSSPTAAPTLKLWLEIITHHVLALLFVQGIRSWILRNLITSGRCIQQHTTMYSIVFCWCVCKLLLRFWHATSNSRVPIAWCTCYTFQLSS